MLWKPWLMIRANIFRAQDTEKDDMQEVESRENTTEDQETASQEATTRKDTDNTLIIEISTDNEDVLNAT